MSIIAKWAVQGVALFLFAWMAALAGQWSSTVIGESSTDRLAKLGDFDNQSRQQTVASSAAVSSVQ